MKHPSIKITLKEKVEFKGKKVDVIECSSLQYAPLNTNDIVMIDDHAINISADKILEVKAKTF